MKDGYVTLKPLKELTNDTIHRLITSFWVEYGNAKAKLRKKYERRL